MWIRAGLAVATLVAAVGGAQAAEISARAVQAVQLHGRARVLVALRTPRADGDLPRRVADIDAMRRGVATARGFRLERSFNAVAALSGDVDFDGLVELSGDPDVAAVDLVPEARAHLAQSVPMIRGDVVQRRGLGGRGVVVAVLDTGVEAGHADLVGDVLDEQCFLSLSGCSNGSRRQSGPGAARDDNGHGTHVAGIITGSGVSGAPGVAPESRLVVLKVLNGEARGDATDVLEALDYVLTRRPDVRLVNMSLGFGELYTGHCDTASATNRAVADAVRALRARGTMVFASSGNEGATNASVAPACIQGVIAVGGVYTTNTGAVTYGCTDAATSRDQVLCFSNSSEAVDLLAPAGPITSDWIGGARAIRAGTSQAAPHAAGAAALLLEANPGLTPDRVEAALKSSGTPVRDTKNGRVLPRIDVAGAADAAQ